MLGCGQERKYRLHGVRNPTSPGVAVAADSLTTVADDEAGLLGGLRIAVVEDDRPLRTLLVTLLASRGAQTVALGSAEALYRHLLAHPCDIVILDVGLPGEDGYSTVGHLRRSTSVGIVMLTGRGAPGEMARGLGLGADLYLVKPVDRDVLVAGLVSLRRRLAATAAPEREVPPPPSPGTAWSLQADGWRLCAPDGTGLDLSRSERAFLQPLFANAGQPVDRETLIGSLTDAPWDFDPHRLEVLVHRLRNRVRAATGLALPLRAPRGLGYLLQPDLA